MQVHYCVFSYPFLSSRFLHALASFIYFILFHPPGFIRLSQIGSFSYELRRWNITSGAGVLLSDNRYYGSSLLDMCRGRDEMR